ncbi:MAG: lysophospholipid acyltransferase family protein [Chloroflexota bacterium]
MQKFLYPLGRAILQAFAAVMLRFDVKHQSPLPAGPKLFVANHPSATDGFLIHLASREEVNVMITEKAFRVPVFGWFLHKVREIPVPVEQGRAALEQARRHLEQGQSVAIFIEGHISPEEGGFLPPRTGAARLALSASVPVVPVGIYLRRNWRLNIRSGISGEQTEAYWYFHGPYVITVGLPMRLHGDVKDHAYVRGASEKIMDSIQLLARESEERGGAWMKSSPIIWFARLLAPLRRKGMATGL